MTTKPKPVGDLRCPICNFNTRFKLNSKGLDGLLGLHIEKKHWTQEGIARYVLYESIPKRDIEEKITQVEIDIDIWNQSAKENGDQGYYAAAASDQLNAEVNYNLLKILKDLIK